MVPTIGTGQNLPLMGAAVKPMRAQPAVRDPVGAHGGSTELAEVRARLQGHPKDRERIFLGVSALQLTPCANNGGFLTIF